MSVKNYYEILGLSEGATEAEIRKKYIKLAAKHHPDVDKAPGASERFKEIKQAYETLYNPKTRSSYDNYLKTSSKSGFTFDEHTQQQSRFQFSNDFKGGTFESIFSNLFSSNQPNSSFFNQPNSNNSFFFFDFDNSNPGIEIENIELSCLLNFNETAFGCRKTLNFTRRSYCQYCSWWLKSRCSYCNSVGYKTKQVSRVVDIPGGLAEGSQIKVSHEGHAYKNYRSDLILNLQLTTREGNCYISGNNIYQNIYLSLFDFVKAREITVKNCVNKGVTLIMPDNIQSGDCFVFRRQGCINQNGVQGKYIFRLLCSIDRKKLYEMIEDERFRTLSGTREKFKFSNEVLVT